MSNSTIGMKQNQDGSYSPRAIAEYNAPIIQEGNQIINAVGTVVNEVSQSMLILNQVTQNAENTIQRYWNAEANKQFIYGNEVSKYNTSIDTQNNLLKIINSPEIKLWRYKDKLYYRTKSGNLIIEGNVEIQKELSSRYGSDVFIVNDMNDVIKNNTQVRVNTVFIAINRLPTVEQELFYPDNKLELILDPNCVWKRNLLAPTRYMKKKILHNSNNETFIKKMMLDITERKSDCISPWVKNIGTENDTILLLIGNQKLSEDLVVNRVIKRLFDTGLVTTLTDDILQKQSSEEIVDGKLFLHINHIPSGEVEREKLKELLLSSMIHRSILSEGYSVPIQVKIIATIDEIDPFFKDMMEITKTLFIDTEENMLQKINLNNIVSLYQEIEKSLDYYSSEISSMVDNPFDLYRSDNQRYLDLLSEDTTEQAINSDDLPILDPYNDNFENLIPKGDYHTLITGLTRIGKSLLMLSLIMRYIFRKDCSIVLFDIHGDLAKKVVRLIKDKERLVYISPLLDTSYSPTINLFDISDKSEKNIARVSQIILRVLKSIQTDETFSGPMEELLLHCIRVLLRKGGGSFIELYRFMNDKRNDDLIKYAKQSPNLLEEEYFTDYFASATATKDAVRRRLSTLLSDHLFSNLMNGTNTIDLEKEMNTPGKIIIIDIPKGEMEITYEYYIKFMLEYIQVLALKRVKIHKIEDRTLTHVFLDEAHNFITPNGNIETILTEAGKYNLYLTMANQAVSQYKTAKFQDIILSMTDAKIIGKNSNDTLTAMNKTLNTKLQDVENLAKGVFYASVANNDVVKFQNTDIFLNRDKEISDAQWQEHRQYQLSQYQRNINPEIKSKLTEDELKQMIDQFKSDIISKNLTESSCLYKLKTAAPERFTEIESDFEYRTIRDKEYRPRMRRPEISTIFKLAFELEDLIDNADFTQMLKGDNDMFDKTDSGTRSKNFGGSSGSEQYYYFEQE